MDFSKQCHTQTIKLLYQDTEFHAALCLASIPLPILQENVNEFLHTEEKAYFSTLQFERRQLSFLLGHFVAKQAICLYRQDSQQASEILIKYGIFNYPIVYIPVNTNDKPQVTYSHCGPYGIAIAFPDFFLMGIDLEIIQPDKKSVMETQMTQEEIDFIKTLDKSLQEKASTIFWSIKEALSKVLRTGMLTSFEIYAIKDLQVKNNYWVGTFKNFTQYQSLSFAVGEYICSIVYPSSVELSLDLNAMAPFF